MATLTPVIPAAAGSALALVAAAGGGDQFLNPRSNSLLHVANGGGAPINVTITAKATSRPGDQNFPPQTVADLVVAVAAGATKVIPVGKAYTDQTTGMVSVGYSGVTSVTVGVVQPE
ncbi:MAG: hypothetical protein IT435_05665 [Phycisphaerales bacterium]|nr:hypothetical protein [Phycisphaerales bacterium]